jgi:hypothetical protein
MWFAEKNHQVNVIKAELNHQSKFNVKVLQDNTIASRKLTEALQHDKVLFKFVNILRFHTFFI